MKKLNTLIIILIVVFVITAGTISFLLFKEKSAVQTSTTTTSEVIENKDAVEVADQKPKKDKEITLKFISDLYPAYPIGYELDILVTNDADITMSSSNENIASIVNNKVVTKAPGMVNITASYNDQKISQEIIITDLYTIEDINPNKPFLKETICSSKQAHLLDDVLERKIEDAGYKTRAGVVAAARFLSLQFPYKLAYMSESGRLDDTTGTAVSDGEGRYYHKGLFLSEDKFDILGNSIFGRATWGQFFEEDDSDDHSKDEEYLSGLLTTSDIGTHLYLSKRPNGLDCSGFIAWCYYNGGFDFGDMGAGGPSTYGMSDLGELVYINDELLKSDRIKAGDLVGFAGHVGIVIGVEKDYIWIADTLITGLKVTKYERNVESFNQLGENSFKYFMLMDSEYQDDGNYTQMW